jgi:hypothetical protein
MSDDLQLARFVHARPTTSAVVQGLPNTDLHGEHWIDLPNVVARLEQAARVITTSIGPGRPKARSTA